MSEHENVKLTRRGFLRGAAGGAAALAGSGLLVSYVHAEKSAADLPEKWDKETDVLVIGAGAAGLFAAIAASDAGADVIVLEKSPSMTTCATALCGGSISGAGTKVQAEEDVEDSAELFYDDLIKNGNGKNIVELTKVFAENSGKMIDKLTDWGAEFYLGPGSPDHSARREHILYPAAQYIEILKAQTDKREVEIVMETPAVQLLVDYETGRVMGVKAEGKGAGSYRAKKAVVLASGGFAGDATVIDRYVPDMKDAVLSGSSSYTVGDGLRMAKKIGADTTHTQFVGAYPCGLELDPEGKPRVGTMFSSRNYWYCILVNKLGKRFTNEYVSATKMTRYLVEQPDGTAYPIADSVVWEEMNTLPYLVVGWPKEKVEEAMARGEVFVKADTLLELAEKLGIDGENLEETVKKYNSYVESGEDLEFGRNPEWMTKLEKPPFYACTGVRPIMMLGVGGLRINAKAQVLDPYDEPIPGLYAAGEVAGGAMGTTYLAGCNVGLACTFGHFAGKNAAAETIA